MWCQTYVGITQAMRHFSRGNPEKEMAYQVCILSFVECCASSLLFSGLIVFKFQ
jgi:hypothetical protein